jgi:hypothetical protein
MTELEQKIAVLRDAVDRFIATAQKAGPKNPVAVKKMLEISIEVGPAMEKVVEVAAGVKKP